MQQFDKGDAVEKTKIALVGVGKIARDQHIPALQKSKAFELAGAVSSHASDLDVPTYRSITELASARPDIRAASICTPPRVRVELVQEAFRSGLDVMIEKPPAQSVVEAELLGLLARLPGRVLFATWHSREAPAVAPARAWLEGKEVRGVNIAWKEDVRVWHPKQEWIWDEGIGVFDPGINALSILTEILPGQLRLKNALLKFPANKGAPIAADLEYCYADEATILVEFNFDQRGEETWDIIVDTNGGRLQLSNGAAEMRVDGSQIDVGPADEYPRLYNKFAGLLDERRSDVDLLPFFHVADAFILGNRQTVEAFSW